MSIAKLYSRALTGMSAPQVTVEVHVASGLPSFSIVGLADTEVRESRDRVRSAIQNSGFDFPARRITVNLAPADLPKDSGRYDLPIALGIMIASGLIKPKSELNQYEFAGELALDGGLRHVNGALAIAFGIGNDARQFILPKSSAEEASLAETTPCFGAESLLEVCNFLENKIVIEKATADFNSNDLNLAFLADFSEVKGQVATKKALEIAAAGRHSLLMIGNPGCGKSMLASRITSILPKLEHKEAIASASLLSLSNGKFDPKNWRQVPFRQPHHSSSATAIVGGGTIPKPGEISLAHGGILFLDELPEFDRTVLEVLREPLETKKINIARARHKVEYLADFQLIAAMNPCPCGNNGHPQKSCQCSIEQINRYKSKISAPLLDRIDLVVEVPLVTVHELQNLPDGEKSSEIAQRVITARNAQHKRQNKLNYELSNTEVENYCLMDQKTKNLVQQIIEKNGMSARSYYRMLKVARTIADLDEQENINVSHIAQASQYKRSIQAK
ncbi:YifB family Mg chelatase-like AAA ATPase [Aquella oligotrophica]|uniref:ATP-dependent protease n=1 Tax=Aquella oligotrophica TaxID=2067065 RepID=A0A2I7N634_9NEIS|nr:YifB family Mg chelatase-like AAA ATPase [Aquella oligotrophica]AUR51685.1 ATP-dependent protease [Aquella oligotrophica]